METNIMTPEDNPEFKQLIADNEEAFNLDPADAPVSEPEE